MPETINNVLEKFDKQEFPKYIDISVMELNNNRVDKSIIGKKFGKLKVLKLDFTKNGRSYWKCKCECGGTKTTERSSLLFGGCKSCGCIPKGHFGIDNPCFIDLKGKKFAKLYVKNISHSDDGVWWNCICDCGKTTKVKTTNLIRNKIKSCGCLRNQWRIINIIGKKIGTYKVIKMVKKKEIKN